MLSETHFLRLSKEKHFQNSITSSIGKNRQLDGTKMKHKRFASAAPKLPCVRTRHSLALCKLKPTAVISKWGMNIYWCKLLQKSIMLQPTIALGFISFWFESSLRHFGEGQWGLICSYYIRVWWSVCLILWCISLTHTRSCVEILFNVVCVCVCVRWKDHSWRACFFPHQFLLLTHSLCLLKLNTTVKSLRPCGLCFWS